MSKEIKFNDNDRAVVNLLKDAENPMTLAEINAALGSKLVAGNINSIVKKGLIAAVDDVEVIRDGKRAVSVYKFVSDEVFKNADGKDYPYSDNERKLLSIAKGIDNYFTLADLNAVNDTNFVSGNINALLKKGNIVKSDEKVTVAVKVKAMVKAYAFVKDIPEA